MGVLRVPLKLGVVAATILTTSVHGNSQVEVIRDPVTQSIVAFGNTMSYLAQSIPTLFDSTTNMDNEQYTGDTGESEERSVKISIRIPFSDSFYKIEIPEHIIEYAFHIVKESARVPEFDAGEPINHDMGNIPTFNTIMDQTYPRSALPEDVVRTIFTPTGGNLAMMSSGPLDYSVKTIDTLGSSIESTLGSWNNGLKKTVNHAGLASTLFKVSANHRVMTHTQLPVQSAAEVVGMYAAFNIAVWSTVSNTALPRETLELETQRMANSAILKLGLANEVTPGTMKNIVRIAANVFWYTPREKIRMFDKQEKVNPTNPRAILQDYSEFPSGVRDTVDVLQTLATGKTTSPKNDFFTKDGEIRINIVKGKYAVARVVNLMFNMFYIMFSIYALGLPAIARVGASFVKKKVVGKARYVSTMGVLVGGTVAGTMVQGKDYGAKFMYNLGDFMKNPAGNLVEIASAFSIQKTAQRPLGNVSTFSTQPLLPPPKPPKPPTFRPTSPVDATPPVVTTTSTSEPSGFMRGMIKFFTTVTGIKPVKVNVELSSEPEPIPIPPAQPIDNLFQMPPSTKQLQQRRERHDKLKERFSALR